MARTVTTHLMYEGAAEEAMTFYVTLFRDSKITQIERYGPGEMGAEGSIKLAKYRASTGRQASQGTGVSKAKFHPFSGADPLLPPAVIDFT